MRTVTIILALMISTLSWSQLKFVPQAFENGFRYPKAVFPAEKAIEDSLNKIILNTISDLEASDFCIGVYGYVQKGSHIQIHMLCNCIDMEKSEHRYILVNLENGTQVPQKDIFHEKEQEKALSIIQRHLAQHKGSPKDCADAFASIGESPTLDQLDLRLTADGIEVRPAGTDVCEKSFYKVTYAEISQYMKYKQL